MQLVETYPGKILEKNPIKMSTLDLKTGIELYFCFSCSVTFLSSVMFSSVQS